MNISQLDNLYQDRHQDGIAETCLQVLQEGSAYEFLWRLARLQHFMGMRAVEEGVTEVARRHFQQGAAAGAEAEKQEGARVEGVFWHAVCDLEAARQKGKVATGLILGAAEKRLGRAAAMDEAFHQAGPVRVLGRILHLKPLVMGGSLDRALTFYDRALQLFPNNSTTLLYKADALLADRQPVAARRVISTLLELPLAPGWMWEGERDRRLAQEWLQTRLE